MKDEYKDCLPYDFEELMSTEMAWAFIGLCLGIIILCVLTGLGVAFGWFV